MRSQIYNEDIVGKSNAVMNLFMSNQYGFDEVIIGRLIRGLPNYNDTLFNIEKVYKCPNGERLSKDFIFGLF